MGFWSWKVHWRFQLQCSGRHARHHDSGALYSGGCVRWPENSGRHPARKFCIPKAENVGGEWSWPWPFYSINVQQESFRRHATILLDKFWDKFLLGSCNIVTCWNSQRTMRIVPMAMKVREVQLGKLCIPCASPTEAITKTPNDIL